MFLKGWNNNKTIVDRMARDLLWKVWLAWMLLFFELVLKVRMEALFAWLPLKLQVCCLLQEQVRRGRFILSRLDQKEDSKPHRVVSAFCSRAGRCCSQHWLFRAISWSKGRAVGDVLMKSCWTDQYLILPASLYIDFIISILLSNIYFRTRPELCLLLLM